MHPLSRLQTLAMACLVIVLAASSLGRATDVRAEVRTGQDASSEVDQQTVQAIVKAFERAEAAIHGRNLDGVMQLYAPDYNYHALRRDDIRKIWKNLFANYRQISTTHYFAKIRTKGIGPHLGAEVTCAGTLWATSDLTNLRVPLDSWHEEIHYLTRENGEWKIIGNIGETPTVLEFGASPHPLF